MRPKTFHTLELLFQDGCADTLYLLSVTTRTNQRSTLMEMLGYNLSFHISRNVDRSHSSFTRSQINHQIENPRLCLTATEHKLTQQCNQYFIPRKRILEKRLLKWEVALGRCSIIQLLFYLLHSVNPMQIRVFWEVPALRLPF